MDEKDEEGKSVMRVMGEAGDNKLLWDDDDLVGIEAARKMFDELRAKGYNAYQVKKDGSKGKIVTKFDPKAEKIILAPPMSGG